MTVPAARRRSGTPAGRPGGSIAPPPESATGAPNADDAGVDLARARAQQLLVELAAIGQRITDSLASALGDLEATGNAPVLVLCDLKLHGPRRPRDLQAVTGLTSGGMTKVLDRLEELGLTERSFGRVPGDRRAIVVSLTSAGERAADTMADAVIGCCPDLRSLITGLAALLD